MKKPVFVLFTLLSVSLSFSSMTSSAMAGPAIRTTPQKDHCSAELEGMPLAEVWDGTIAEFRQKFSDRDSTLILVGKMETTGNFLILKFVVGSHSEPVEAGFYATTVNDSGTREYKRGSLSSAEPLFSELKGMNLNAMKTREVKGPRACPPLSPYPSLYFVESRLGKGNRFGFYGYPYKDKRYVRIMEIVDAFHTSKN